MFVADVSRSAAGVTGLTFTSVGMLRPAFSAHTAAKTMVEFIRLLLAGFVGGIVGIRCYLSGLRRRYVPTYPAIPVDCLISELGEMFMGGVWKSQADHEARFWERVQQFKDEAAAE